MIDIVIVSNSETSLLRGMTSMAIRTARDNAGIDVGKIVVIEQCRWRKPYKGTKTLHYDFEFNYNKCLNLGFSVCKSQYVAFCNNDLHFGKNWALNAILAIKDGYLSVSPTQKHIFPGILPGYEIGKHILGWCIIMDRIVMDRIGQFDCPVDFWYSDNVYALQIQAAEVKHALVGNSYVRHFTSTTLGKVRNSKKRMAMQIGQEKIFNKYKQENYVDTGTEIKAKKSKSH